MKERVKGQLRGNTCDCKLGAKVKKMMWQLRKKRIDGSGDDRLQKVNFKKRKEKKKRKAAMAI